MPLSRSTVSITDFERYNSLSYHLSRLNCATLSYHILQCTYCISLHYSSLRQESIRISGILSDNKMVLYVENVHVIDNGGTRHFIYLLGVYLTCHRVFPCLFGSCFTSYFLPVGLTVWIFDLEKKGELVMKFSPLWNCQ